MPTLQDVAGDTGIFTDGNWILSENMDANGKYGVIQLKHVGIGEFLGYKDFNFINEKTFNDLRCTEVLPGDVLISRMADPIGRACIVPQLPFPCVTAVDVTIVRIDKNIAEPEFIMHLCNSPSMREKIDRAVRGTTRARITRTELGELEIPLLPLTEQKRIASLLARADRLRQLRRTAHDLGDALLQSVFLEMFGDPISNSKHWDQASIKELGKVVTGSTPPTEAEGMFGGSTPFITPGDLTVDTLKSQRYLTEKGAKKSRIVRAGSTLVCCIGATIGKTDKAQMKCAFNQQINAIEWNENINDDFGLTTMKFFSRIVAERGISTTLPILKKSEFEEIVIPVPPLCLQEEFAGVVARVEGLRGRMSEAGRQADGLFESLLAEAFSA